MRSKNIILIPHWVAESLGRNKLAIADCLNLDRLRSVISINDLATFLALQDQVHQVVGGNPDLNFMYGCSWTLQAEWAGGEAYPYVCGDREHLPANARLNRLEERPVDKSHPNYHFVYEQLHPLAVDATTLKELNDRLFSGQRDLERYEKPFITYDLTREIAGIVINPGLFTTGDHIAFVEAVLKLCYVYQPYHEVCMTTWYKRYLELLSVKQIVA